MEGKVTESLCDCHRVTVSFHDIVYEAGSCLKKKRKVILHGVSGMLPQGLNAIMGPTGSGKTRYAAAASYS